MAIGKSIENKYSFVCVHIGEQPWDVKFLSNDYDGQDPTNDAERSLISAYENLYFR